MTGGHAPMSPLATHRSTAFCDHHNYIIITYFQILFFFHNEYKMKPINFTKWQMALVC